MLKPFLMIPVLLFFAPAVFQQAPSTPPAQPAGQQAAPSQAVPSQAVPGEWVNKVNPVKPTPESQARAKQIYGWDCAMCHGDNGNGKGDVAVEQKLALRDFRDAGSLSKMTDGEMFYTIHDGKGQMPAEGPRAKTDEVWNLVIYLRKMSNTQAPAAATTTAATQ
ncbi:MAG TPA: cytochrome c [Acidobacteriaceae bacterium]|jgi:mono/diheme cytochrome c family protein|nr:cytochrome c [Acidobacteriaceae bacterium]